ncbi:MAG: hotdog fold thioesterase [Candidatus Nanopelagicales bacterium]
MPDLDPDLDAMIRANLGELASSMGVVIDELSPDRVSADMPVAGNRQPYGLLHGGASAVLAETIGSIHAAILAPENTLPVGIELSCTHHRSAREGSVHAESTPVSHGRTLATFTIAVTDDEGRRCCTARLTCLYRAT